MTNMNTEMIISISYIMIYEYETCVYISIKKANFGHYIIPSELLEI